LSTYSGKFSDGRASDAIFKQDKDIIDSACEGNSARPKLKGWNNSKGGYGSADNSAADPDLKYSGGNGGFQGGDTDNPRRES
jgi:hypothetical protein